MTRLLREMARLAPGGEAIVRRSPFASILCEPAAYHSPSPPRFDHRHRQRSHQAHPLRSVISAVDGRIRNPSKWRVRVMGSVNADGIKRSTPRAFTLAAVLLATACGNSSSNPTTSPGKQVAARNFDEWYKSFVINRHYKTCVQEIARLDPSADEQADWDAGERQLFVGMPGPGNQVMADMSPTPFVPGLEICNIPSNYTATRNIWNLEDSSSEPATPEVKACTKAALAYLSSYNSLRVKRHPSVQKELCSGR